MGGVRSAGRRRREELRESGVGVAVLVSGDRVAGRTSAAGKGGTWTNPASHAQC